MPGVQLHGPSTTSRESESLTWILSTQKQLLVTVLPLHCPQLGDDDPPQQPANKRCHAESQPLHPCTPGLQFQEAWKTAGAKMAQTPPITASP